MKLSENWLKEMVDASLSHEQMAAQLTMLGLEVAGAEAAAPEFTGVVVGKVVSLEKHPNADKLNVCQVDAGEKEHLQIVCGAPNVKVGGCYPLAKIGGVLPGNFKIKRAKLRGVESFGMLCSAKELGLSEDAAGLMSLPASVSVGEEFQQALQLDDTVLEVDLTPNRGDCLSVAGIAREVATVTRSKLKLPVVDAVKPVIKDNLKVKLHASDACPRYVGRIIRNIDIKAAAPVWLVEKLRRGGIRSINAVVDVMNYVMLELGQPMHAFDLDKLSGGIVVRMAKEGETIALLDESEATLSDNTLVIADNKAPCAIAGIMGGAESAVSASTQHVFLESAFFTPQAIAGKARQYGKHTDSSHRFERGVDPELQVRAIERATSLLLDIVGGQAGTLVHEKNEKNLPKQVDILLRASRIKRLLGIGLEASKIESILSGLGMTVQADSKNKEQSWRVTVPLYRFDIQIEADLIEELARVYGYTQLPYTLPEYTPALDDQPETRVDAYTLKSVLVDRGYQESISYSFVDPKLQTLLMPETKALTLANPISSEMSDMRTSLIPGLISSAQYNLNRQQKRLKLFETGLRFIPQDTEIKQEKMIAGLCLGNRNREQWSEAEQPLDFFDVKGDVEALLALSHEISFEFKPCEHTMLHPGQSASLLREGVEIGILGALHPSIAQKLDIQDDIFLFEIQHLALEQGKLPHFEPLSRFPANRRDIAIIVDENVQWSEIEQCVRDASPEILKNILLFDIYTGKGVTLGRKSVAMGLILQEISRTLTDTEIEQAVTNVLANLEQKLGATRRE